MGASKRPVSDLGPTFSVRGSLLSPSMVDSGAFWHKTSGTSDDAYAAPTEASLLKSGVPNTPTHPLNYPEELGAQLELKNYLVYFQHIVVLGAAP